jgi:hypothetical protein
MEAMLKSHSKVLSLRFLPKAAPNTSRGKNLPGGER